MREFNDSLIKDKNRTLYQTGHSGALRKLVASGELKREGKGKSTCYYRTKEDSLKKDDFPCYRKRPRRCLRKAGSAGVSLFLEALW